MQNVSNLDSLECGLVRETKQILVEKIHDTIDKWPAHFKVCIKYKGCHFELSASD